MVIFQAANPGPATAALRRKKADAALRLIQATKHPRPAGTRDTTIRINSRPKPRALRHSPHFQASFKPDKGKITRHLNASVPPLNLSPEASQPLSFRTIIPHRPWLLGHEHDAAGALVLGATISPQHQYNLTEMGLA